MTLDLNRLRDRVLQNQDLGTTQPAEQSQKSLSTEKVRLSRQTILRRSRCPKFDKIRSQAEQIEIVRSSERSCRKPQEKLRLLKAFAVGYMK